MNRVARQITTLALIASTTIAGSIALPAVAQADTPQACSKLGGVVGAEPTCHAHDTTSAYTLDIGFPLDYPDQKALTEVLLQDRDEFVGWVAEVGPDSRGRPYGHVVSAKTYRSGPPESGTQSVVLKIQDDTGVANQGHPNTSFTALNYDIGKHAPIAFDTLFKPGSKPLQVLNPIVSSQLQRFDSSSDMTNLDEHAYRNFAITDDAVLFFFGQEPADTGQQWATPSLGAARRIASLMF